MFRNNKTNRCVLRKTRLEDAADLLKVFGNDEVMKYIPLETFQTLEDAEREIHWHHSIYNQRKGVRFGIIDKKTNKLIGTCGFVDYDDKNKSAEIGYDLSIEYWGKGIMTEVGREVIRFAFEKMELNRIEAKFDAPNKASKGLLIKLGFQKEGVLREYFWNEHKPIDVEVYSLLNREFNN
ncbi:GNAT family N-acetyltransferase [Salinibacillus xinjiangensis]|uniref:GNAT family N-acetyltransferase n=1 Tax=Salinibacillus xinjiangensis TaxID=1229268 RepID=A0A6G1X9T0_9BACI|nr:GNAT family N-acetyltransferase [Salinibacillus xinjiangensis]MRG87630.1 GNAT family N-acetyltransferase [Salinibacillus xinjiangensis]